MESITKYGELYRYSSVYRRLVVIILRYIYCFVFNVNGSSQENLCLGSVVQ